MEQARLTDGWSFTWAQWSLTCAVARFKDNSAGTSAELTITRTVNGKEKILTRGMVNL